MIAIHPALIVNSMALVLWYSSLASLPPSLIIETSALEEDTSNVGKVWSLQTCGTIRNTLGETIKYIQRSSISNTNHNLGSYDMVGALPTRVVPP